jgi:putative peptide zinc metalloprotease protein
MSGGASPSRPLPELRAELQLLAGAPHGNGEPSWLIHDPLLNRFTQIDCAAYEALRLWKCSSTVSDLIDHADAHQRVALDEKSVNHLIDFLYANQLTVAPRDDGWRSFATAKELGKHSLAAQLVHNYLFFRIPLCTPQAALERTLPLARALWTRPMQFLVFVMGIVGLYLVSRQWEVFLHTLQTYFTWEGAVLGALALVFVKTAHELGHAFTAVAFGCRVHTMGVAFVVMTPMPYTDVTDSWRLKDRRQRLLIDSAGIIVEVVIAAVALFIWTFLPDGALRSAAFVMSAVSAVSSLAVNLNPFMRFDGYYLLSEMLAVENLQPRAFALGRWKLRELLFGLGLPRPEDMPGRLIILLVLYAWAVWIYRVILFVGIAVLVYHYFFKVLGIILFAVEIIFFVARPINNELTIWFKMRAIILKRPRSLVTLSSAALMLVLVMVPWSTSVEIPTVIESANLQMLYPARAAKVVALHVKPGASVRAGDPIVQVEAGDLDDELRRTRISLRLAVLQYDRRVADAVDREGSMVLQSTIDALTSKIAGLEKEREELTVVAPFDGIVAELNPELHVGSWIGPRDLIAVISGGQTLVGRGYVAESDLKRLAEGNHGVFVPEYPLRRRFTVAIDRIATAATSQIDIVDLASTNTGRIAVNPDERRRLVPASAQYSVHVTTDAPMVNNDLSIRGVVLADGQAESVLARTWRRVLGILVRESGA